MKTKIILFIMVGLFLQPNMVLGVGYIKPDGEMISSPNVDDEKNIITVSDLESTFKILQPYTSAAFRIYLTSTPASGTTTGKFTMYKTSFTLEQLNSGGGSTTNYFTVLPSTCDAIIDIVSNVNTNLPNFTFTLSQGCYGLQLATGTVNPRTDSEDSIDGLQYDVGGKAISFSTGIANEVTIYLNATKYISYRKEPVPLKNIYIGTFETNVSYTDGGSTLMEVYEGNVSTNCVTLCYPADEMAASGVKASKKYEEPFIPMGASGYAQEYRVTTSGTGKYITGGYLGIIGKTK